MIAPRAIDPSAELQRAFDLLGKNIVLALPTAIAALIVQLLLVTVIAAFVGSIVAAGYAHSTLSTGAAATAAGFGGLLVVASFAAMIVVSILAHAVVVHAAETAWEGRTPDLGASMAAAVAKLPALVSATVGIFLIMLIPAALSVVVIGLPLLVVGWFFLMYAIPAVMIGNRGGFDAIGTSIRIARANVGPSAIALVAMVVAAIIGAAVSLTVGHVPVLGWIAAFVVGGFTQAFIALVDARFYTLLRTE